MSTLLCKVIQLLCKSRRYFTEIVHEESLPKITIYENTLFLQKDYRQGFYDLEIVAWLEENNIQLSRR